MIRSLNFALALFVIPSLTLAQSRPVVEIGTSVGGNLLSDEGEVALIGVPGAGLSGMPVVYASIFSGDVFVEPQVGLAVSIYDGGTDAVIGLGGQVGYMVNGPESSSPFGAVSIASLIVDGPDEYGAGVKVGYRLVIAGSLGLRVEGGYRRWFGDNGFNEALVGIGFGAVVNR